MKLRDYQIKIATEAAEILQRKKLVAIFSEVRTGKTLMALQTCQNVKASNVLFITKKKAISSIENDYVNFGFTFELVTINRESLHTINTNNFDVVIVDEVHGYTAYPKPSKYYKEVKQRFGNIPMIFLSGTPTPESYSQYYHLFTLSNHHPFNNHKNFYKWASEYVNVKQKRLGYATVNDYSDANKKAFWHLIRYYIITFTQAEAGFTTNVNEMVLEVEMKPITYKIIDKLCKDLIATSTSTGKSIVADTAVKLQQKVHQLSSGTIKYDDGSFQIIDNSKALYIAEHFKDYKIAILYNFVAELEMLKQTFGDKLTNDIEEFNTTDKWFVGQIVSSREGINLSKADALVMFNIQFSAVSYFQSKDRMSIKDRKENNVFWLFSKGGIESKIYQRVMKKLDYTNENFRKEYGIRTKITNENNKSRRTQWLDGR